MRNHAMSRGRLFVVCVLGALAGFVPTASADTALPVWTCRGSAAYVEVNPLLAGQRVEPVLANGFPNRDNPDTEPCSTQNTGVQRIEVPPSSGDAALITAEAASASTEISPEIGDARGQIASADAGIADTVRLNVAGLVITASAITSTAEGKCMGGEPVLTSSSTIVSLSISGQDPITIPNPGQYVDLINLPGVLRVRLNEKVLDTDGVTGDQTLTQRALHIEILPSLTGGEPAARVVLGETQVDFHGDVCAPPPPVAVCPPNTVAQQTGGDKLVCAVILTRCFAGQAPSGGSLGNPPGCVVVCPEGTAGEPGQPCVRTITNTVNVPCPSDSVADATRGGACVVTVQSPPVNCPTGTNRDPATNNCVLIRDRPCPAGATADPTTRVCVVTNTNNVGSGENGRVGSRTGPVATCGRLTMRFVRGTRNFGTSFTSRFGTRTVTRGKLVTCGSNPKPIVGARLDVTHILPGDERYPKTGLRTREQGRSTLILPINLRTRKIEYAYRPDLRSTRVTSRVTLSLTVKNRAGRTLR